MSSCAIREQLEQLVNGQLNGQERDTVAAHVEECAPCQQVLDELTRVPRPASWRVSESHADAEEARLLERLSQKGPRVLEVVQESKQHPEDGGLEHDGNRPALDAKDAHRPGSMAPFFPVIPGFTFIREIGRGGMGVVYEADEEILGRRVALKVLPGGAISNPRQVERFRREAKAAARLHHTNIVPVFGVGEYAGQPYYVMEYIDGHGLDVVLKELRRLRQDGLSPRPGGSLRPLDGLAQPGASDEREVAGSPSTTAAGVAWSLANGRFGGPGSPTVDRQRPAVEDDGTVVLAPPIVSASDLAFRKLLLQRSSSSALSSHTNFSRPYFQSVARIGLQAAEALDYANRRGVLHRDIKPSNLLLDTDGTIRITDFGLAKIDDSDALTDTGDVVGTLQYMAPERFQRQCDVRSDVYSLGLTLYELVALRRAYEASDRHELLKKVVHQEPERLSKFAPKVPRDLETIIRKAIAREPARRYPTAAELAEDLRRFLDVRTILARRASTAEQLVRWANRNRWVAGLSAAVVAALVGGTVVSTFLTLRATRAERGAQSAAANARNERDRAEGARDMAFRAVQTIISTDNDQMTTEEARPYRAMLLDEGLRLSREMVEGSEGDARAEKLRAEALMMEAKILLEKGERARAEEAGQRAIDLAEGLVDRHPSDIDHREGLAHLLHVQTTICTLAESNRSHARRSNEFFMALLLENPRAQRAADWAGFIAVNLHNIGDGYFRACESARGEERLGLLQKAIETFLEGRTFLEKQVRIADRRDKVLRSLAVNARYLCRAYRVRAVSLEDLQQRSDVMKESIEWGEKGIADFQALLDQDPANYQYSMYLNESQRELGITFYDQGNWGAAIKYYEEARATLKRMDQRRDHPISRVVQIKESIVMDDFNLFNALTPIVPADEKRLLALLDEIDAMCERLDLIRPLSHKLALVHAHVAFAKADAIAESTGVPDVDLNREAARLYAVLLSEDPKDYGARRYMFLAQLELADALAARGRNDESKTIETEALANMKGYPDVLVQTAQTYAFSSQEIMKGPSRLDAPTLEKLRQRHVRRVIPLLRDAVESRFQDADLILKDSAFTPFRSDPDFQAIVRDLVFASAPFARKQ
jgi:serine/threonine protein kinase